MLCGMLSHFLGRDDLAEADSSLNDVGVKLQGCNGGGCSSSARCILPAVAAQGPAAGPPSLARMCYHRKLQIVDGSIIILPDPFLQLIRLTVGYKRSILKALSVSAS
jgi:hypothetical protein